MSNLPKPGRLANPFDLDEADGYRWLKGNLHTHTTNSDGRLPPQERIDRYASRGYDFLALTDHVEITRTDALSIPEGLVTISGVELHTENRAGGQTHHFLALNVHDDVDAYSMTPQEVIGAVKAQGGSIWLAHPYWSSVSIERDALALSGIDGLEVFNSTCHRAGRGESAVHWDQWMDLSGHIFPAVATDDAHRRDEEEYDTYLGWTMVRARDRSPDAIVSALVRGASYSTTGPTIRNIEIRPVSGRDETSPLLEAVIGCSQAVRVAAISNVWGSDFHLGGKTFETATIPIRPNSRHVRFEITAADGTKAWSNPFLLG